MGKDSQKVSLDALVAREAFEIQEQQNQNIGRNNPMISVRDLEESSFFYPFLRKPDFQRETNEWDAEKICDFIKNFLDGDLIPAVILWKRNLFLNLQKLEKILNGLFGNMIWFHRL